jgi:hypothetical protein
MSIRWTAASSAGTSAANAAFIATIMCISPNSWHMYFLKYFAEGLLIDHFKLVFFCFMFKSIYLSVFACMLRVEAINTSSRSSFITIIIKLAIVMKLFLTILYYLRFYIIYLNLTYILFHTTFVIN